MVSTSISGVESVADVSGLCYSVIVINPSKNKVC